MCRSALPHSQGQVLLGAAPTPTLTLELSFPPAFILCGVSLWLRPQKLTQFLEESGPSLILGCIHKRSVGCREDHSRKCFPEASSLWQNKVLYSRFPSPHDASL